MLLSHIRVWTHTIWKSNVLDYWLFEILNFLIYLRFVLGVRSAIDGLHWCQVLLSILIFKKGSIIRICIKRKINWFLKRYWINLLTAFHLRYTSLSYLLIVILRLLKNLFKLRDFLCIVNLLWNTIIILVLVEISRKNWN